MLASDVLSADKGHCTVFTKFMENYRLSASLRIGTQPQALRRPDGTDEFFALRGDNYVERFSVNTHSSTGYISETTALHGSLISATQDANSKTLVFAAQAEQIYCLEESSPGSATFKAPALVFASLPHNARKNFRTLHPAH